MDETVTVYFPEKIYDAMCENSMKRGDTIMGTVSRAVRFYLTGQIPYIRGVSKNDIPVKIRLSAIEKPSLTRLKVFSENPDRSYAEMIRVCIIKYFSRRGFIW